MNTDTKKENDSYFIFEKKKDTNADIKKIRTEILPRFFASSNLNFLIGTGCSIYAGAKSFSGEMPYYKEILIDETEKNLKDKLTSLLKEEKRNPEIVLNELYEIQQSLSTLQIDTTKIEKVVKDFKENYIKHHVLDIIYNISDEKNAHNTFLTKLTSRDAKLGRPNIFTLNYDLLFEMAGDSLGIYVNNGFHGLQNRFFNPSNYDVDIFIKSGSQSQKASNSINLYKLHGSLSWSKATNSESPFNLYDIFEKQLDIETSGKVGYEKIKDDFIIYPESRKTKNSLDVPYNELFRRFIEAMHQPSAVLFVLGYGFGDDHVNKMITNAFRNPDFHLLVFMFSEDMQNDYYSRLKALSNQDSRISIFVGEEIADFINFSNHVLPFYDKQQDVINQLKGVIKELSKDVK